jgi:hypothetical protein
MNTNAIVFRSSLALLFTLPLLGACAVETSLDDEASLNDEGMFVEESSEALDSACAAAGTPHPAGTTYNNSAWGTQANGTALQLWTNGVGSGNMTVYNVNSTFKAAWNNSSTTTWSDYLARVGWNFSSRPNYTVFQALIAGYAFTPNVQKLQNGNITVGIYGWSKETTGALHEYYIVDYWATSRPQADPSKDVVAGTITVDGDTYDIFKHKQINQPTIDGTKADFWQFFSVRRNKRTCGHINILAHFAKWDALGLDLGGLYETKILVESYGYPSVGSADFTYANIAKALN